MQILGNQEEFDDIPRIALPSKLPKSVDYINLMLRYLKPFGIELDKRYELHLMKAHRFIVELSIEEKKELSSYQLILALHDNP